MRKAIGSITGQFEELPTGEAIVKPAIGPDFVECSFNDYPMPTHADGRHVTLRGELLHHEGAIEPYRIDVCDVEIHPLPADLPRLSEMCGFAPKITGDLSTMEYMDQIRSYW